MPKRCDLQSHDEHRVTDGDKTSAVQAVERCKVLCTEVSCPAAVRQLFHSSTVERANQGCLLEQARTARLSANLVVPFLFDTGHSLEHPARLH